MKRFMKPDELERDTRFTRTPVPLDFLMAEEVTVEQDVWPLEEKHTSIGVAPMEAMAVMEVISG